LKAGLKAKTWSQGLKYSFACAAIVVARLSMTLAPSPVMAAGAFGGPHCGCGRQSEQEVWSGGDGARITGVWAADNVCAEARGVGAGGKTGGTELGW
jgi:hypothetical protein